MSWFRPRPAPESGSIPRMGLNIPMPAGVKPPRESWETLKSDNDRLKKWLRYIRGNYVDHKECAERALSGEDAPITFEG